MLCEDEATQCSCCRMQALLANGGWGCVHGLAQCTASQLAFLADALNSIATAMLGGKERVQLPTLQIDLQQIAHLRQPAAPLLFIADSQQLERHASTFLREVACSIAVPGQQEQRLIEVAFGCAAMLQNLLMHSLSDAWYRGSMCLQSVRRMRSLQSYGQ